jgi:hypothetical protein
VCLSVTWSYINLFVIVPLPPFPHTHTHMSLWAVLVPQYIAVSRPAFCYHYMPGLLQAELLLVVWLDAGGCTCAASPNSALPRFLHMPGLLPAHPPPLFLG